MTKKVLITLFLFICHFAVSTADSGFKYDLHLTYTCGDSPEVMVLAHGMGGNYRIARRVPATKTLVSFNFPDHDYGNRPWTALESTFGTIDELLPLIYVINKCVVTDGQQKVDLYGFSAGGGAIINAIAVLNSGRYEDRLREIGVGKKEKDKMLQAIQKGVIILDTPLKSIQEIVDFRGSNEEFAIFEKRYQENEMEPIEALKYFKGLTLNVVVHFQDPDEVLSNRDDELFFDRLRMYNPDGVNTLFIGTDNGHRIPHPTLWKFILTSQQQ